MRILLLLLCTAFAVAGCDRPTPVCGSACGEPKPDPGPEGEGDLAAGRDATPDPLEESRWLIDFGPTAIGRTETRTFRIRNEGKGVLVPEVRMLEGEFTADEPNSLRAGAEGEVHFRFQPGQERKFQAIAEISAGESVIQVRLVGQGFEPGLACPDRHAIRVPTGGSGILDIVCTNESPGGYSLKASIATPFWIEGAPEAVEAEEEAVIQVGTNLAVPGTYTGTLSILGEGQPVAQVEIEVEVFETARLVCDAGPLEFETVLHGDPDTVAERQTFLCRNEGGVSTAVEVEAPAGFQVEIPYETIEARSEFPVNVVFAPTGPGTFTGAVRVVPAEIGDGAEVLVEGTALAPPTCHLELEPMGGVLDFHTLPAEHPGRIFRELVFRVEGDGCEIRNLQMDDPEGVFTLWESKPSLFLPPGERSYQVEFRPNGLGTFEATLRFLVLGEAAERTVGMIGRFGSCLDLVDRVGFPIHFQHLIAEEAGCAVAPAEIFLLNRCDEERGLESITPIPPSSEFGSAFRVLETPELPAVLAPGERVRIVVGYESPSSERMDGGFTLDLADGTRIWLEAEGTAEPPSIALEYVSLLWSSPDAVDVIFVVDDGLDGASVQSLLQGRYGDLVAAIDPGRTWRMAFTTTAGGTCPRTPGALHAVLDASSGSAASFDDWIAPGVCDGPVDPFGAALEALGELQGGWPHQADLHIVFVTEKHAVGDTAVEPLLEALAAGMDEGRRPATIHLIEPAQQGQPNRPATPFHVAVRATAGSVHSVDSSSSMAELSRAIYRIDGLVPLQYPATPAWPAYNIEMRTSWDEEEGWELLHPDMDAAEIWRYLPFVGAIRVTEAIRGEIDTVHVGYLARCERESVTAPAWP